MPAASLVVRIGADLADFSKALNKMTRDVDKAAERIGNVGKTLTEFISVEVAASVGTLAKLGAEAEQVGMKFERTFGPGAAHANEQLTELMKLVPATRVELQRSANQMQDFARGLGLGQDAAAKLSVSLLQLSARLSAGKFIGLADAEFILMRALEGQTRSLKALGIVLDEHEVKLRAQKLGLASVDRELSPLGKALASYSMLVEKSNLFSTDAAKRQQDVARQFAFAKRDLTEFAYATGALLIPAMRLFVSIANAVIHVLSATPAWLREVIIWFSILAATLGPILFVFSKLTIAIFTLRAAMLLLAEGSALQTFLGLLTSPKVLVAVVALAAAIAGAIALWNHFHKDVKDSIPDLDKLVDIKELMRSLGVGSGMIPLDELQALNELASKTVENFHQQLELGGDLQAQQAALNALNEEAVRIYDAQADKLGKVALAAQRIAIETFKPLAILPLVEQARANVPVMSGQISHAASAITSVPADLYKALEGQINDEINLRARELRVSRLLPDTFDAVRMASLELKEQFRNISHDFHSSWEKFKGSIGVGGPGVPGAAESAKAALEAGFTQVIDQLGPFALIVEVVAKVLQGFMPVIDKLLGPFVALGQILADVLMPILRIIFPSLKMFGIAVAFVDEVLYSIAGGIAKALGSLIKWIGKTIGSRTIRDAGDSMIDLGDSLQRTAHQLDQDRVALGQLKFDDAANGLNRLSQAASNASESLANVPSAFKIQLRRYEATQPLAGYGGGGSSASLPVSGAAVNIHLNGRVLAQVTWQQIRAAAKAQFGDPSRVLDVAHF